MTIRKLFSKAAAVVLSLCLIGGVTGFEPGEFAVDAAEEQVYGDFLYIDKGDYIEITGLIPETIEAIKNVKAEDRWNVNWGIDIPEYIYDKPVTSIGTNAFSSISSTEIAEYTNNYSSIVVEIPRLVNNIAYDAFDIVDYPNLRFIPRVKQAFLSAGDSLYCPAVKCLTNYFNQFGFEINGYDQNGDYVEVSMDKPFGLEALYTYEGVGNINDSTGNDIIYDPVNETLDLAADTPGDLEYSIHTKGLNWDICIIITTNSPYMYNLGYTPSTQIDTTHYFSNSLNDILDESYATSYNPELAYMLCIISQNAYYRNGIYWDYRKLGFNNIEIKDYDTTYTQDDNCGYVIGYQDLDDGTREFLITVRGTASKLSDEFLFNKPAEWYSDFTIGFGQINPWVPCPDYHDGFEAAANRICESLKKYNDGTIRTKKVRYVLTGHSRGAAVSNLVSKWLIDSGVNKSDLYSYNFACPGTAIDKESEFTSSKYISIFNLNCARDLVGQAPGEKLTLLSIPFLGTMSSKDPAQWGKYGQTYFWDADWDSSKYASVTELGTYHPCDTNYIPYFSQQNELSEFKTFYDMKNIQDSNWYKPRTVTLVKQINIFPPFDSKVGATISDATGNIVATLKNGILEIVSGMEDKMIGNIGDDGVIQIAVDSSEEYQVSVTSDEPVTIAVAQGNQNYNSVNNGAVYTAAPGNTTIDITPDTRQLKLPSPAETARQSSRIRCGIWAT